MQARAASAGARVRQSSHVVRERAEIHEQEARHMRCAEMAAQSASIVAGHTG